MKNKYKPSEISNGDLRVPVTFFRMIENEGPLPGSSKAEDVFTTLCEVYESSTKDLEKTSSVTGINKVTINFRNPHLDYLINHSDTFELIHYLYQDLTFRVIDFAPNSSNKEIIKVVGVANGN